MRKRASYEFLLTTWEGGGNVSPVLTVARRLLAGGHGVRVMSDEVNRAETNAAGAEFVPWHRAPSRRDKSVESDILRDWEVTGPEVFVRLRNAIMLGPARAYAEDTLDELARKPADLVVSSEMLFGVMAACEAAAQPLALFSPNISLYPIPGMPPIGPGLLPARTEEDRALHAAVAAGNAQVLDGGLPALNAARQAIGLSPMASVLDQLHVADRVLLGTSRAFDFPADLPEEIRYVGAQLDEQSWAEPWTSPWGSGDDRPLALVSFSTTFQDQALALQRVADAAAELPMRAVVTLGPTLSLGAVSSRAENVHVCRTAPHGAVLREAALAVTHGGHGTTMRALAQGLPVLVLPRGRDQNDNAARVEYHGAGLQLPRDASTEAIRAALHRLLKEPAFTAAARRLGAAVRKDAESSLVVSELLEAAVLGRVRRQAGSFRAAA